MKWNTIFLGAAFLLLIYSCKTQMKSIDFTAKGEFTDGIEGPATDHLGNIYAVNFLEQGTIGKVTPEGKSSLFVTLPNGSIGNGIRFGNKDQMFIADYTNHNILKIDMNSKDIEVFAHQPNANQPNDIAISSDNILYASDPNWTDGTGNIWKISKEKGFELLEANMGTTNGIEVSPDGKKLYVNESVQRNIWVYDILNNGSVANKRAFYSFEDFGLDGMRFHENGNLFVCRYGKGTVDIISPNGKIINEIKLTGEKPTNITFSNNFKKCYITMADRGCLEVVDLD